MFFTYSLYVLNSKIHNRVEKIESIIWPALAFTELNLDLSLPRSYEIVLKK